VNVDWYGDPGTCGAGIVTVTSTAPEFRTFTLATDIDDSPPFSRVQTADWTWLKLDPVILTSCTTAPDIVLGLKDVTVAVVDGVVLAGPLATPITALLIWLARYGVNSAAAPTRIVPKPFKSVVPPPPNSRQIILHPVPK
jgi:hypothetical protein